MSPRSERPQETAEAEEWIAAARAGDREALGRLLEMFRHYLLLVANEELAPAIQAKIAPSDIVQDSLMEACRDLPLFHGGSEKELLNWLRRILRNNVAKAHRHFDTKKRQVEREVALQDIAPDDLLHGLVKQPETPSKHAQAHEQDEQLQRAMQQLPEHYRQVLLMRSLEGLTFVQIAEKLNSTDDAVRKLWGRAVEELSQHLETPHEPP